MLNEKFARDQIFIQHDFSLSNMIFSFVLLFLRSVKPIQHFIQHDIFVLLDEMLDRFNKTLISESTKELCKNFMTVQNPCFDLDLEACRNFGILVEKPQCNEAMNEAIFEWQTIKDVLQNKFFLEFPEVSRSKASVYLKL